MSILRNTTEHQSWDLCMKSGQSPFKLCCATLANRGNHTILSLQGGGKIHEMGKNTEASFSSTYAVLQENVRE